MSDTIRWALMIGAAGILCLVSTIIIIKGGSDDE